MGRSRKPGTPGRTTIPPKVTSDVTGRLVATFRRFGSCGVFDLFVIPQQCYLYVEVKRRVPGSAGTRPPIPRSSTTHIPLGRLKYIDQGRDEAERWELQTTLWSDETWDERSVVRGSPENLMLSAIVGTLPV